MSCVPKQTSFPTVIFSSRPKQQRWFSVLFESNESCHSGVSLDRTTINKPVVIKWSQANVGTTDSLASRSTTRTSSPSSPDQLGRIFSWTAFEQWPCVFRTCTARPSVWSVVFTTSLVQHNSVSEWQHRMGPSSLLHKTETRPCVQQDVSPDFPMVIPCHYRNSSSRDGSIAWRRQRVKAPTSALDGTVWKT